MSQHTEMTSSLNDATSELPDVNVSIYVNVNVTTATGVPGSLARNASTAVFVRAAILSTVAVINLCGNGFTLITIRKTPRLWTKTNFILASMLVANIMTAVLTFWYVPFILVVYVFNNPCRFNVVVAALTPLMKMTPLASNFHLILISVERYIAIVYPLHYETKFNNRTLKWALFAAWVTGIFFGMTYALWLINADHRKCSFIPAAYHLVDLLGYIPVCISLFICYGKIISIAWRRRRRIEPVKYVQKTRGQKTSPVTLFATQRDHATTSKNTVASNDKSLASIEIPLEPAVTSGAELTQEQQRQKIKSRRREFKAVYLTVAIVGTFVILWFPHVLGRVLESINYDPVITSYISQAGGAIGAANIAFAWAIYAAVSKSYRRAYRQMLNRIGCCCCKNITLPADNSFVF